MRVGEAVLRAMMALCVGACADADHLGRAAQPIVGGVVDRGDVAVVALTDADGEYFCSGTIVDAVHVITAAHCVKAGEGETPAFAFACADNNGASPGTQPDCFLGVTGALEDPEYDGGMVHDIAVVTLAAPTDITPVRLRRTRLDSSAIGTTARIVGYGDDADGATGVKREADATISSIDGATFTMLGTPSHCYGDSGGPAFWPAGDEALVGIASSGVGAACAQGGIDSMVADSLDWLASVGVTSSERFVDDREAALPEGSCAVGSGKCPSVWLIVLVTAAAACSRQQLRGRACISHRKLSC